MFESCFYCLGYGFGFFGLFLILFLFLIVVLFILRMFFRSARRDRLAARRGAYADSRVYGGTGYAEYGSASGPRGGRGGGGGALGIARRRYARGEITKEQYDQIVSDLARPPPGGP